MSTQTLIRWSGGAFILAGAFQIFGSVFHGSNGDPQIILAPTWVAVQLALLVFYVLSWVGLDRAQGATAGKLGKTGVVLAFIGSAATVITSMGYAFILPAYAVQQNPPKPLMELLDPSGPLAWLLYVTLLYIVLFVPGYVMTGIATVRARVLPRWAGLMLIVGNLVSFIGAGLPVIFIGRILGGVIFALGLMWLGYMMWAKPTVATLQPQPAK